ncbi:hypothetical protein COO20_21215 [Thalassospira marina]|uniref:Uncharacterized protein n=2 Tax=Thalassospira marina TaxID=2048283 RepID=A0A2N3KIM4_9PROT|nr:hypothetical protein COO20_21215 [Thalassospira marina]
MISASLAADECNLLQIAQWALEFMYAAGPDPLARSVEERLIIVAKSSPELMSYVARAMKALEDVFENRLDDEA